MASVASQLIEEVTAHAQSDSLEDAREICADGTYFPNNLRIYALFRDFLIRLFLTLGTNKELTLSIGPPADYAIYIMCSTLNSFFSLILYLTNIQLCSACYVLDAQLFL